MMGTHCCKWRPQLWFTASSRLFKDLSRYMFCKQMWVSVQPLLSFILYAWNETSLEWTSLSPVKIKVLPSCIFLKSELIVRISQFDALTNTHQGGTIIFQPSLLLVLNINAYTRHVSIFHLFIKMVSCLQGWNPKDSVYSSTVVEVAHSKCIRAPWRFSIYTQTVSN